MSLFYKSIDNQLNKINAEHMTHNQVVAGSSRVDIREVCSDGKELTQDNAYRNASVSLVNAFFSIAEANGFTSNYSYGVRPSIGLNFLFGIFRTRVWNHV